MRDGTMKLDTPEARATRYTELRSGLREIDSDITRLRIRKSEAVLDDAEDTERHNVALAMLHGEAVADVVRDLDHEITRLTARRTIISDALNILKPKVYEDRRHAGGAVVKSLRPAHSEAVKDMCSALLKLAEANARETQLRQQVPGTASASLPVCVFPGIGDLGFHDSPISYWLRHVENLGVLTRAEIDALRKEVQE